MTTRSTRPRAFARAFCLLFALSPIVLAVTPAAALVVPTRQDVTRRVRFARGRTTAVRRGTVVRGTRDRYLLAARRGQKMTVRITSLERNAVFDVCARATDDCVAAEQTEWVGSLPETTDYEIVVGGTRGNASYKLEVTIR